MDYEALFAEPRRIYERAGIFSRVGFGRAPAVVVVDLCRAFTDPRSRIGADLSGVVAANRRLLDAARDAAVPVVFTTMGYRRDMKDAGAWCWKYASLTEIQAESEFIEIDPGLGLRSDEVVIRKDYPSAFFGTTLRSMLTAWAVDTVVVTGTTTSGCVRATVVDAVSCGYRVVVPAECAGDRHPLPHVANLFDIDSKYGDVVPTEEAIAALRAAGARAAG